MNWERQILYYVGSVEHPDGETLTYTYDDATLTTDQYGRIWRRPARITSNRGEVFVRSLGAPSFKPESALLAEL